MSGVLHDEPVFTGFAAWALLESERCHRHGEVIHISHHHPSRRYESVVTLCRISRMGVEVIVDVRCKCAWCAVRISQRDLRLSSIGENTIFVKGRIEIMANISQILTTKKCPESISFSSRERQKRSESGLDRSSRVSRESGEWQPRLRSARLRPAGDHSVRHARTGVT
jgi:hypothetical protein